jgi:hypothetical protein
MSSRLHFKEGCCYCSYHHLTRLCLRSIELTHSLVIIRQRWRETRESVLIKRSEYPRGRYIERHRVFVVFWWWEELERQGGVKSSSANEVGVEAGRKTVNQQQMNFSFSRFPPTHHASFSMCKLIHPNGSSKLSPFQNERKKAGHFTRRLDYNKKQIAFDQVSSSSITHIKRCVDSQ